MMYDYKNKKKLKYISLWIAIAGLWVNQLIHTYYEHQEHQQLQSKNQQIIELMEIQLETDEELLQNFQEFIERIYKEEEEKR